MNSEQVQEELARLTRAVVEEDALYAWFLDLKKLPEKARMFELNRIAREMRAAGEDPELISATELLAQPHIFAGVSKAIDELRGGSSR